MKHIKTFYLILILSSGLTGCIREDNSNCPEKGFYVCFLPENPKHDYADIVRVVDLYFYDETGNLYQSIRYAKQDLRQSDMAAFVRNIPAGRYTMVSIINDVEDYRTDYSKRLESLKSLLVKKISNLRLVDFFSGIMDITVAGDMTWEISADIFKHNNNILFEIIFDGYETPQGSHLSSWVEGNNGIYDHLAGTCPGDSFRKYLPYWTKKNHDGVEVEFNFSVMRLWRTSDLTLYLKEIDASKNVVQTMELNVAEQLVRVRNEQGIYMYDTDQKLSFHDDYKIAVKLGPDFILLELIINDWWIIKGGVEL